MKTLDEVITALEVCTSGYCSHPKHGDCPYLDERNDCDTRQRKLDALHYLKTYKDDKDDLTALRAYWKEQHENNALTWEELKQMEGKPVWVEILSDKIDLSSRWMMVARETKAHSLPLAYTDDMGHWIYGHEDDLGKTWQAYRKKK